MPTVASKKKRTGKVATEALAAQPPPKPAPRLKLVLPATLLFASGIAGLVYQVLWIKQLSLVVGVDVHAISTAVSAFFAGLALGGYVFGRYADRLEQPLRLYAILEFGVAILGVGATLALAHAAPFFAQLEARAGVFAWLLPFTLVGVPATLMGGTLPVLMRALAPHAGQLGTAGGRLYAANTAGAITGALLTALILVPSLGVQGSALAAGAINITAAFAALAFIRNHAGPTPVAPKPSTELRPPGANLALILYTVAGGLALGYEVIWSQAIVQWTSTRTFAFSVVLATYLTGLVLGSALTARRADRSQDPWGDFGLLITAAGAVALLALTLAGNWLPAVQVKAATLAFHITHHEPFAMAARFFVAAAWLVLIPTLLLGAAFPVVLRLTADPSRPGHSTGTVLALNTAGGIAGTLFTGFVLVPQLGLERSLALMAVVAALVGAVSVLRGRAVRPIMRWAALSCGAIAIIAAALIPPDHLARLLASTRRGELQFYEASSSGAVAVIQQGIGKNQFRRLYIQGVSNSGDSMTSLRYMRLQALLPLLIHQGEPRSALVIGLGTGITAGSLLHYPGLERRVCAELLPAVVRAAPLFSGNRGVTTDSRIDLRVRDGRRELLRSTDRYDLITLEPPPPSAAGVVNLYSRDFYTLAASRLEPNGLVAQWLPLPTQTNDDTRSLVRSFLDAFPHATLWTTELHEMLLIGSPMPIRLDATRITSRFHQPDVAAALGEVGIASPAALLATWVTDRAGLERYAGAALPTTDDRPRIEHGDWVMPGEFTRTLPDLMTQYIAPPLPGEASALLSEIENERDILLRFYEAGIYAYRRDNVRWQKTMAWVLRKAPGNPYYHWFVSSTQPAGGVAEPQPNAP